MEETKEVWDEYGRLVLASRLEEKEKSERKRGDGHYSHRHHSPEGSFSRSRQHSPPFKRRRRSEEREDARFRGRNPRFENEHYDGRGRGSFGRKFNDDLHPMNFKQFAETQPEDLKAEELQKRFEAHLEEFKRRSLRNFWETHKDDAWMKEKYSPIKEEEKRIKGIEKAKREAENFDRESSISLDFVEGEKPESGESENKEKFNLENSLFIRAIPVNRTKSEIINLFSPLKGYIKSYFTQPIIFRKYSRNVWIFYQSKEDAEAALNEMNKKKIDDFELEITINSKEKFPFGGTKVAPACSPEKIGKDLQLAIKICNSLDSERDLESFESFLKEGGDEKEKLDLLIRYLRTVHSFCFYCGEEFEDEDEMLERCGEKHIRGRKTEAEIKDDSVTKVYELKILKRIDNPKKSKVEEYKKKYTHIVEKWTKEQFTKLEEEKFKCAFCVKSFKNEGFVVKHINLKHSDKVDEQKEKALEDDYMMNYMEDPCHITPPPQPPKEIVAPPLPLPLPVFHPPHLNGTPRSFRGEAFRTPSKEEMKIDHRGIHEGLPVEPKPSVEYVDLDSPNKAPVALEYSLPKRRQKK